jgi:hypothetical protein
MICLGLAPEFLSDMNLEPSGPSFDMSRRGTVITREDAKKGQVPPSDKVKWSALERRGQQVDGQYQWPRTGYMEHTKIDGNF